MTLVSHLSWSPFMSVIILHCMSIVDPSHCVLLGLWISLVLLRAVAVQTFTLTEYWSFGVVCFLNLCFVFPC